jgi:AcrR family transcriptional regulator
LQTLKDEVKNKIIEAAVGEFLVDGYANSSLRQIAAQASITIGNIYSYFSSKEDLFDQIVSPAWVALDSLMNMPMAEGFKPEALVEIGNIITQVFIENKKQFFILLNGSGGTKYENIRDRIEDFISLRFQRELRGNGGAKLADPLFAKALAAALFAGFVTVFNQYGGDDERLKRLLGELLSALLGNTLGGD